jgi:hypothetical protein
VVWCLSVSLSVCLSVYLSVCRYRSTVTRWLAAKAEALGVDVFPGFAASEVLYGRQGEVGRAAREGHSLYYARNSGPMLGGWVGCAEDIPYTMLGILVPMLGGAGCTGRRSPML